MQRIGIGVQQADGDQVMPSAANVGTRTALASSSGSTTSLGIDAFRHRHAVRRATSAGFGRQ
jgi:hypothetical protein